MPVVGGEAGWTSIGGKPHYGKVTAIDSNVVYIQCRYCGKEVCTEWDWDEEDLPASSTDGNQSSEG